MIKRLNIENFEGIEGKETANFKIWRPNVSWEQYSFCLEPKNGFKYCFVTIERTSTAINRFHLEIAYEKYGNIIYKEDVHHDVFKRKLKFFQQMDKIIMEKLKSC